ncbi:meiosis-specific kinetochore protein isoform X2 [Melanerpes formicivorus]|uniref:meiosis-specific kinetochore protein isoform X2 n=1 Tax=Melanerpes formicivorus TaxID=211600 RepID=UPI00358E0960
MERFHCQGPCRGAKAPLKMRRSSPVPGVFGSRAGSSQSCRRRLFEDSGPSGEAEPRRLKRKANVKTLPKIKEKSEMTQVRQSCNESNRVNVQEETDLETKEYKIEESSVQMKESLLINYESKESLKCTEVTSSTGMTLPTGVSTFLLECLDTGSTEEFNTGANSSLSSCSSPEIFRDEGSGSGFYPVDSGKYKNSTLLDSSKAMAIDKIPHLSNLSTILEPVEDDFPDQYSRRERLSHCIYTSSSLSVSSTVAGKKACKITAARERTPNLKTAMRCSSPLGPERQPENQTAKPKGLVSKVKEHSSTSGGGPSSLQLLGAPGSTSARAVGLTAKVLPHEQTRAVGPPCGTEEICSIVKLSPPRKLSRPHQIPADTKAFSFPKRLPEDNITSTENWVYCKHR